MGAIVGGRSVANTMGFNGYGRAADGHSVRLSLDPGVVLYLLEQHQMDVRAIEKLLYSESGLLGVSGVSSDVRTLLESESAGAKLAIDLYVYRIGRELGSLAAALGGLDRLVFTAGIGENAVVLQRCSRA